MTRLEAMDRAFENDVIISNWPDGVYTFGGMKPPPFGRLSLVCNSHEPFDFDKWDIVYRMTVDADGIEIRRMKP